MMRLSVFRSINIAATATVIAVCSTCSTSAFSSTQNKKMPEPNINSVQYHQPSKVTLNFCEASRHANLEIMEMFLKQGAEIDSENCTPAFGERPSETTLMRLARSPYEAGAKAFDFLLNNGANANYQTKNGETPLMILVQKNGTDLVFAQTAALFDHGAKVDLENALGNTALGYVVSAGYRNADEMKRSLKTISYLVQDKGADINHKNKAGKTPLMLSAEGCGVEEVKLLLGLGADAGIHTPKGDDALSIAAEQAAHQSYSRTCTDVVQVLQNAKDYSKKDLTEKTPVAATASSGTSPTPDGLTLVEEVKKFEKDKTSYSDVTHELGEPASSDFAADTGRKTVYYAGMTSPFNATTTVPISALFGQNSSVKGTYVAALVFDKNDRLIGYSVMQVGNFKLK